MKRDMNLIRELLLKIEARAIPPSVTVALSPHDPALAVDGFTADEIGHHLRMLVSARFIETPNNNRPFAGDGSVIFRQISWEGHDFLDSVRAPRFGIKLRKEPRPPGASPPIC